MVGQSSRFFLHVLLIVSTVSAAGAQENLDFESSRTGSDSLPEVWYVGGRGYSFQLDSEVVHGGRKSLRFERIAQNSKPGSFGVARQRIPIDSIFLDRVKEPVEGVRRLRLRGFLRCELVDKGYYGLWLRVDDAAGKVLAFDNMSTRGLTGTVDWAAHEILLTLPKEGARITFGALLSGSGRAWVDDLSLDLLPPLALPEGEALAYLERALSILRQHSLRRDVVDWTRIQTEALDLARGAAGPDDVYPAIHHALRQLGDGHSFLMTPEQNHRWRESPPPTRPSDQARPGRRGLGENGESGADPSAEDDGDELDGRLIMGVRGGRHGYVQVPSFASGAPGAASVFAESLTALIAGLDVERPCGWLVDLRQNTGGNMSPMLLGLGPILGAGTLGFFVVPQGLSTPWIYEPGRFLVGDHLRLASVGEPVRLHQENPRVAVLTGSRTSSSGEAVVVAFRGRPATRSFGVGTSGQSSANSGFRLSDGAMILLTTSLFADRTGQVYRGVIEPDVKVEGSAAAGVSQPSPREDPVVTAALAWLESEPCPGVPH